MSFEKLGLRPALLAGVKSKGYVTPTPIQQQAIPVVIQGKDVLAGAQTGTGKTAAFTLPLLHLLSNGEKALPRKPRALVLTPTRELAAQVADSVKTYGQGVNIRSAVVFGGVGINPQINNLRNGVDILIGTPGRLLDLINQKALNLSHIEILVLDEADRMLDMGFIHDIRKIIDLVPQKRQTLFFSATYSAEIKKLADTILYKPTMIEVARENIAADNVDQDVYRVAKFRKREMLIKLIKDGNWSQVLVFARTKHGANRLAQQLHRAGITAAAIHGDKSQGARTKALADFKACKVRALVATDIAARGLDINRLPHVVNFDLPQVAEDYIHRIGRTGRAGSSGKAISLVCEDEVKLLKAIERLTKSKIQENQLDGFCEITDNLNREKSDYQPNNGQQRSQSQETPFYKRRPKGFRGKNNSQSRRRRPQSQES